MVPQANGIGSSRMSDECFGGSVCALPRPFFAFPVLDFGSSSGEAAAPPKSSPPSGLGLSLGAAASSSKSSPASGAAPALLSGEKKHLGGPPPGSRFQPRQRNEERLEPRDPSSDLRDAARATCPVRPGSVRPG